MTRFLLIALLLSPFLISCSVPEQQPELKDAVYLDLVAEKAQVVGLIASTAKEKEGFETELAKVAAQSGQRKYYKDKIEIKINQLMKLRQHQLYYEVKAEKRRYDVREAYIKSFYKKEHFETTAEADEYFKNKKARSIASEWSAKNRIEAYNKTFHVEQKSEAAGGRSAAPAEPPPSGGH